MIATTLRMSAALLAVCGTFVLLISPECSAADVFWKNPVNGNWSDAANWSGGQVPGAGDEVFITTSGTYQVNLDQDAAVNSLQVGGTGGTQTVVGTGQSLTLAQRSTFGNRAVVQLKQMDVGGAGRIDNRGGLDLFSSTINNELHNAGEIFVENPVASASQLLGSFVNGTNAVLSVSNNENFPSLLVVQGGTNQGKITLTSESGEESKIQYTGGANAPFVNVTGATICTVPNAGGKRLLSAGNATSFINNGDVVAFHPLTIENRQNFVNRGLVNSSFANVTVANVGGSTFINDGGKLLVTVGTVMTIDNGTFEPREGRVLGDGTYQFNNTTVRNGTFTVACTRARFFGTSVFEDTSPVDNQGKMDVIGVGIFNSELFNLEEAIWNFHSFGSFTSFFEFNADFLNEGKVNFGTEGTANFSVLQAVFKGSEFENQGEVNSMAAEGSVFNARNLDLEDGAKFTNCGSVNVFTTASLGVFATDAFINSAKGSFNIKGDDAFLSVDNDVKNMVKPSPITFGNIDVPFTTAIVSISMQGPIGKLFFKGASNVFHNNGTAFLSNADIFNTSATVFQGDGVFSVGFSKLNDPILITSSVVEIAQSQLNTTASLSFAAPTANVVGVNKFFGDVNIDPNSVVQFSPEGFIGSVNISANEFHGKFDNKGMVKIGVPGTMATLKFVDADFSNQGLIENLRAVVGVEFEGSTIFNNGINGEIDFSNGLPGSSFNFMGQVVATNHGAFVQKANPIITNAGIAVNGNAKFDNFGSVIVQSPTRTIAAVVVEKFKGLELSGGARFFNGFGGTFDVKPADEAPQPENFTAQVPGGVDVKDNARFVNEGQVNFSTLFPRDETQVVPSQPSGHINLGGAGEFINNGKVDFRDLVLPSNNVVPQFKGTTASVLVENNAAFVNNGRVEVRKVVTTSVVLASGSGTFRNNGKFNATTANPAAVIELQGNGLFDNFGDARIGQPTVHENVVVTNGNRAANKAHVQLRDDAKLVNHTGATLNFDCTVTNNLVEARDNTEIVNCGLIGYNGKPQMETATVAIFTLDGQMLFTQKGKVSVAGGNLEMIVPDISMLLLTEESSCVELIEAGLTLAVDEKVLLPGDFVINGNGTFSVIPGGASNAGTTSPGRSPGVLTIGSDYELTSTSTIEIEIGGVEPGSGFDKLIVEGVLTLDGELSLALIDGFVPADGAQFVIMEYESVTGAFAAVVGATQPGGVGFTLDVGATQAVVTASAPDQIVVDVEVYFQGYWNGESHKRTPFMLELREGPELSTSAVVARASALHSTGASTRFEFDGLADGSYWLVVRHGGHIPLASAAPVLLEAGSPADVDLSQSANVVGGLLWLTDLPGDVLGALSGELNADNSISADDFVQLFTPNFGVVNPGQVPPLD